MFYTMASQLKAIEQQLATAQINATMLDSLKGVNSVMSKVNANMNPQEMNQIMKQFAKETEKMNIKGEMMNGAMDAMGDGETENQADEVYNQILGEIGNQGQEIAEGAGNIAAPAQPIGAVEQVSFLFFVVILFRKVKAIACCLLVSGLLLQGQLQLSLKQEPATSEIFCI